jgi:hypothetical protein
MERGDRRRWPSAAPAATARCFISFLLKLPEGAQSCAGFSSGEEKLHWHSEDSPKWAAE